MSRDGTKEAETIFTMINSLHVCHWCMCHLLILTQSGGTVDNREFFTSIRNWSEEAEDEKEDFDK